MVCGVTALVSEVIATLLRVDIDENDWPVRITRPDVQWEVNTSQEGVEQVGAALAGAVDVEQLQRLRLTQPDRSVLRLPTGVVLKSSRDDVAPGMLDPHALSSAPNLRHLEIVWDGNVQVWLPDAVESLVIDAPRIDLSELAGHSSLWDLTLGGAVQVRQLAALPALIRLDASEADIDDIVALADLDLRVLILGTKQWQQLRAADRLPKRLAGAQWLGEARMNQARQVLPEVPSISEALAFNDWLRSKVG